MGRRRQRWVSVGVGAVIVLAGCSSHAGQSSGGSGAGASLPPAAAPAGAGAPGADPAAGGDAGTGGADAAGAAGAAGADPAAGGAGAGGAGGDAGAGGGTGAGGDAGAGGGTDPGAAGGGGGTGSSGGSGGAPAAPPADTTPVSVNPESLWLNTATGLSPVGSQHSFDCPARQAGWAEPTTVNVWGGPYTNQPNVPATYHDASSVCYAAVHAGKINTRSGGSVTIEIQVRPATWEGSTRNGVKSEDPGGFEGLSFRFL